MQDASDNDNTCFVQTPDSVLSDYRREIRATDRSASPEPLHHISTALEDRMIWKLQTRQTQCKASTVTLILDITPIANGKEGNILPFRNE